MADLKKWQYGPAESVAERRENYSLRDKYGCSACIHRGEEITKGLWDLCQLKQRPKPRYCHRWQLDDDAEVLR